jgi:hypothetical protein
MGCYNSPYNVGSQPASGGWYVSSQYPMQGYIFVASPLPPPASSYGTSTLTPGLSCLDIYTTNANARQFSGTYYIVRSSTTIPVYCDMLVGGGGWTMVAVIASSSSDTTWTYDATTWTSATTINPTVTDISTTVNVKNLAFSTLAFTNVRFNFGNGPSTTSPGFVVPTTATSASALFGGGMLATSYTRADFVTLINAVYGPTAVTTFGGSPNCNTLGVMMSSPTAFCRFGIAFNNENDCSSCDAW